MAVTWKQAVKELASRVAEWAPQGMEPHWHPWPAKGDVQTLELSKNGIRLYLEPAEWAMDELPTSVDLWSDRGPRVRLVGPDGDGKWRVLTSDLIDMHKPWDKESFAALCNDLLAVCRG